MNEISDEQCKKNLRKLQEYYPDLTFQEVRKTTDEILAGKDSPTNVVAVMLKNIIIASKRKSK